MYFTLFGVLAVPVYRPYCVVYFYVCCVYLLMFTLLFALIINTPVKCIHIRPIKQNELVVVYDKNLA